MRKENRPDKSNTAWFEPYSRTRPWRELLRQRQVRDLNPKVKILSSGLAWVSLQVSLWGFFCLQKCGFKKNNKKQTQIVKMFSV